MGNDHRNAFLNDPAFLNRIKGQLDMGSPPPPAKKPASRAVQRAAIVRKRNKDGRRDTVVYDTTAGSLVMSFPGAALLAMNLMMRMHDAKASGLKATWHERVRALVLENRATIDQWKNQVTFPLLVEEVYITSETALLDNESVAASCKPVIDAVVRNGVIPDDSSRFLSQPLPYTERGKESVLVLCFRPSPKPWGLIQDETVEFSRSVLPLN